MDVSYGGAEKPDVHIPIDHRMQAAENVQAHLERAKQQLNQAVVTLARAAEALVQAGAAIPLPPPAQAGLQQQEDPAAHIREAAATCLESLVAVQHVMDKDFFHFIDYLGDAETRLKKRIERAEEKLKKKLRHPPLASSAAFFRRFAHA